MLVRPVRPPILGPTGEPVSAGGDLPWDGVGGGGGAASEEPEVPETIDGLALWLRADTDDVTLVSSRVSLWADRSGNGNDVSQSTEANRPTRDADNSAFNDMPTIDCDDSVAAQYLEAAHSATLAVTASGYNVFAVMSAPADASNDDFLAKGTGVGLTFFMRHNTVEQFVCSLHDGAATAFYSATVSSPLVADDAAHIVEFRFNGTDTLAAAVDGTVASDATKTGVTDHEGAFAVGSRASGGQSAAVKFAEIVVYQRQLEAAERASLIAYFEARYGL